MQWQLIETDDALRELLVRYEHCRTVMVDTEFMRRNTFYPEVALLQLCFAEDGTGGETAWLIDPLAVSDTAPLVRLLQNVDVLKVLHSAGEDLEVFQRWLGVLPQPLFDTQRAAALLNLGFGIGYRALVQQICGVDLPKGETRSDWLQRPLTASQCEYAGLDVTWLLPVWRHLYPRCEREGRLQWVLADGRDAINQLSSEAGNCHERIKKCWKLDRRQLGRLAAICLWREQTARARNKPRAWIVDDEVCLQLAVQDPDSLSKLQNGVVMPVQALRRYGDELLQVLSEQRRVADEQLPAPLPAPLDAAGREQVKRMKAHVREIADALSVAPEVLVQSRDYELLLREYDGGIFHEPVHWRGWRKDAVFDPLRVFLSGSRS